MAYIDSFMRLVVAGTCFTTERFSYSLSIGRDFNTEPATWTEVPAAIISAVTAFHQAANLGISSSCKVDLIKFNEIGTDGRYVSTTDTILHEPATPIPGPAATAQEAQIALAVTLATAKIRGRAHAGRFYVPMVTGTLGTNGALSPTSTTDRAAVVRTFLNALNAAVGTGWRLMVVSDLGLGAKEEVTYARVGAVLDTIRSRRRSIPEDYVDSTPLT